MTYNVFGGTLNIALFMSYERVGLALGFVFLTRISLFSSS